jgi:hypothetical protein
VVPSAAKQLGKKAARLPNSSDARFELCVGADAPSAQPSEARHYGWGTWPDYG